MSQPPAEIQVHNLDHLGIVAGIIDSIGLVEEVDRLLGTHPQEHVSCKKGFTQCSVKIPLWALYSLKAGDLLDLVTKPATWSELPKLFSAKSFQDLARWRHRAFGYEIKLGEWLYRLLHLLQLLLVEAFTLSACCEEVNLSKSL
nr:DUF4277 domain-containing protein [Gloeobacter violaceus]